MLNPHTRQHTAFVVQLTNYSLEMLTGHIIQMSTHKFAMLCIYHHFKFIQ